MLVLSFASNHIVHPVIVVGFRGGILKVSIVVSGSKVSSNAYLATPGVFLTNAMAPLKPTDILVMFDAPPTIWPIKNLPLALNLLNPGGIILLHDYFPSGEPLWKNKIPDKGPYMAIKRAMNENENIKPIPLGCLPWETKLNSNMTSLAIISKKWFNSLNKK